MDFAVQYSWLIPVLPLIGAAIAGLFGARWLKQRTHWAIWLTVGASAVLSFILLWGMWRMMPEKHESPLEMRGGQLSTTVGEKVYTKVWRIHTVYKWIEAGPFQASVGFLIDPLTVTMLCVVTGIGFLITIFSAGYMAGDSGYFRFFAYLGLFIFAMTTLVMAENFVLLYLGWEGVGLCSYLLIGHYYDKPSAREAAKKAFLVNRIGDFGFALGIMLIFTAFGTVSYFGQGVGTGTGVLEMGATTGFRAAAMQWIPFLLMLGAFGKSAQFPLYVWLPDAMEGPTPVSALIHAATMVTAGVYMIVRCGPLFVGNGLAVMTVAAIGTFTAIFAATIALRQFDLKKVFAYSTISQLGFMFAGAGLFAPVPAIFHLVTHAFFKALLFLSSGVVMHAMLGELDMRKMSGLNKVLPKTNILMLIGCLALAGFPFFSGFFSKDEIIGGVWAHSRLLGSVLLVTAFLTAYYTFRLYFRVFQGPLVVPPAPEAHGHDTHGADHGHHNPEPALMILPLIVLAIGAVLAGYLNWPEKSAVLGRFLHESPSVMQAYRVAEARYGHENVPPGPFGGHEFESPRAEAMQGLHTWMMVASLVIAILGIYVAYLLHGKYREQGDALPRRFPAVNRILEAKYWVDEVYQAGIVEPLRGLGRLFFAMDRVVVDGIIWVVSFVPQLAGFTLKLTLQRGSLQGYALMMLLALALILLVVFL